MAEGFSPAVHRIVERHIQSVAQLEVLLLLHRQRESSWTAAEVAEELRIDDAWAASQLEELVAGGFLKRDDQGFRYAPREELAAGVAELEAAYRDRRVSLITLIFSKPVDKVRLFADAFRLRKDPEDG